MGDSFQGRFEVRVGLDAVNFCRFDERHAPGRNDYLKPQSSEFVPNVIQMA